MNTALDNPNLQHTQGRVVAQPASMTLHGTTAQHFAVGVPDTNIAVAITGLVDDDDCLRSAADARRIAACWNRLDPFTTEQIEDCGYDLFSEQRPQFDRLAADLRAMQAQRDALLAACLRVDKAFANAGDWPDTSSELMELHEAISAMRFAMPETEAKPEEGKS